MWDRLCLLHRPLYVCQECSVEHILQKLNSVYRLSINWVIKEAVFSPLSQLPGTQTRTRIGFSWGLRITSCCEPSRAGSHACLGAPVPPTFRMSKGGSAASLSLHTADAWAQAGRGTVRMAQFTGPKRKF